MNPMGWVLSTPSVYNAAIAAGQFFFLSRLFAVFRAFAVGGVSASKAGACRLPLGRCPGFTDHPYPAHRLHGAHHPDRRRLDSAPSPRLFRVRCAPRLHCSSCSQSVWVHCAGTTGRASARPSRPASSTSSPECRCRHRADRYHPHPSQRKISITIFLTRPD